jgi:hypothetical protein
MTDLLKSLIVISTEAPEGRSGEIYSKTDFSTRLRLARNEIPNSFQQSNTVTGSKAYKDAEADYR